MGELCHVSEATSETTPEVTSEVTPEVTSEVTPEVASEAVSEVVSETRLQRRGLTEFLPGRPAA
jgi:hypothetical protein